MIRLVSTAGLVAMLLLGSACSSRTKMAAALDVDEEEWEKLTLAEKEELMSAMSSAEGKTDTSTDDADEFQETNEASFQANVQLSESQGGALQPTPGPQSWKNWTFAKMNAVTQAANHTTNAGWLSFKSEFAVGGPYAFAGDTVPGYARCLSAITGLTKTIMTNPTTEFGKAAPEAAPVKVNKTATKAEIRKAEWQVAKDLWVDIYTQRRAMWESVQDNLDPDHTNLAFNRPSGWLEDKLADHFKGKPLCPENCSLAAEGVACDQDQIKAKIMEQDEAMRTQLVEIPDKWKANSHFFTKYQTDITNSVVKASKSLTKKDQWFERTYGAGAEWMKLVHAGANGLVNDKALMLASAMLAKGVIMSAIAPVQGVYMPCDILHRTTDIISALDGHGWFDSLRASPCDRAKQALIAADS